MKTIVLSITLLMVTSAVAMNWSDVEDKLPVAELTQNIVPTKLRKKQKAQGKKLLLNNQGTIDMYIAAALGGRTSLPIERIENALVAGRLAVLVDLKKSDGTTYEEDVVTLTNLFQNYESIKAEAYASTAIAAAAEPEDTPEKVLSDDPTSPAKDLPQEVITASYGVTSYLAMSAVVALLLSGIIYNIRSSKSKNVV